jgi:hypothetical protein
LLRADSGRTVQHSAATGSGDAACAFAHVVSLG